MASKLTCGIPIQMIKRQNAGGFAHGFCVKIPSCEPSLTPALVSEMFSMGTGKAFHNFQLPLCSYQRFAVCIFCHLLFSQFSTSEPSKKKTKKKIPQNLGWEMNSISPRSVSNLDIDFYIYLFLSFWGFKDLCTKDPASVFCKHLSPLVAILFHVSNIS